MQCYVAGAIPLAFNMSEVRMQVRPFWCYEMLSFLLISVKALVVSQADYTDHLVFAPGTLGQCKARQLRQRKHGDYVYLLF